MPHTPDIYNLLTGFKIDDATITQLDSATKESFVNEDNADFWRGPIFISKVLEAGRTYPHGLPIPDLSAVNSQVVANGASGTLQPTGTEVWLIESISNTGGTILMQLADGSAVSTIKSLAAGADYQPSAPLYITNSLYLALTASSDDCTVTVAYHKVSL